MRSISLSPTQAHLGYLRNGCSGCSYHADHDRYASFRSMRQQVPWQDYLEEMESSYRFYLAASSVAEITTRVLVPKDSFQRWAEGLDEQAVLSRLVALIFARSNMWWGNGSFVSNNARKLADPYDV